MTTYTCQIDNIGPFVINSFSLAPQHAPISPDPIQAQVGDMMVTKAMDANSPMLAQASANGTSFGSATVTVSDDSGGLTVYTLNSVVIASYQPAANGNEALDLNFGHIEMSVTAADAISGAG